MAEQPKYNTALYLRLSKDDGWSGTNTNRPSFQRMLSDIEDGKINCVITKDLSRLGRNYLETGSLESIYKWSMGLVREILRNPVYKGAVRGQKRPKNSLKSEKRKPVQSAERSLI